MGGKTLDQLDAVRDMFSRFWQRYSYVDGCLVPESPGTTIPIFIHGDEGRGQCKRPNRSKGQSLKELTLEFILICVVVPDGSVLELTQHLILRFIMSI